MLILLDNFEHVLAARESLLPLLEACPRLVMLVTSRVSLDVRGGREYPIAPLVLPGADVPSETLSGSPAVQLFVERARATGTKLTLDTATARAVAECAGGWKGCRWPLNWPRPGCRAAAGGGMLERLGQRLPGAGRRARRSAGPAEDHAGRHRLEL